MSGPQTGDDSFEVDRHIDDQPPRDDLIDPDDIDPDDPDTPSPIGAEDDPDPFARQDEPPRVATEDDLPESQGADVDEASQLTEDGTYGESLSDELGNADPEELGEPL